MLHPRIGSVGTMASFNIVTIRRPENQFISAGFRDIGLLLQYALRSLGHQAELQDNVFAPGMPNIVLGYHLLPDAEAIRRHPAIVYQLEQLPDQHQDWLKLDERKTAILKAARAVWDFSPENIAYLAKNGIDGVRHLPFGFHEARQTIVDAETEFDVLFYGVVSPRRKRILDALAGRCRLKTSFGIYGARRDQIIARSKIVLNLRNSAGPSIMEQPRISHLLNNRRFLISENAADNPYGDAIVAVAYDELVDCCLRYRTDGEARRQMAQKGYEYLAQRPMTAYLQAVLD